MFGLVTYIGGGEYDLSDRGGGAQVERLVRMKPKMSSRRSTNPRIEPAIAPLTTALEGGGGLATGGGVGRGLFPGI